MSNYIRHILESGLSVEDFSQKADIAPERISLIIQGSVEPKVSELRRISGVLKLPLDLLLSKTEDFKEIKVLFRQKFRDKEIKQQVDRISFIIGNVLPLLKTFKIDKNLLKSFSSAENTFENARLLAAKFRVLFCNADFLSPLFDLPRIVSEELNFILFVRGDIEGNTDGASLVVDEIPFIFISPRFPPRMLFTLAHEVAHIIYHLNSGESYATVDKNVTEIDRNRLKEEAFANAFASELLMPEEGIGVTLKSLRSHFKNTGPVGDIEIIYLSRIYGVSFDVAARRCEDLNLLPKGGAISISEKIREDFGSAEKRAEQLQMPNRDKIFFPKVSSNLLDAVIDKIDTGEISIGKASEILAIPMAELIVLNSKER